MIAAAFLIVAVAGLVIGLVIGRLWCVVHYGEGYAEGAVVGYGEGYEQRTADERSRAR